MAEMRASPVKIPGLKTLADIVRMVEERGQMEILPFNPATLFPVSSTTLENLAYGNLPMAIPSQSNIPITKTGRKQEVAELAGLLMSAQPVGRGVAKGANYLGDVLTQAVTRNPQATSMRALEEIGRMSPVPQMFDPALAKRVMPETKAVDEAGNPVMVYHGTADPIQEFSKSKLGGSTKAKSAKEGFFFQDNPSYARNYADYAANDARVQALVDKAYAAEKRGNWDEYDDFLRQAEELEATQRKQYGAGQNIIPAYLDMKNPFVFDAKGESYTYIEDSLTNIIQKAKKQGHDGVIFQNLDDIPGRTNAISNHYVVFDPKQIKSAISDQDIMEQFLSGR
jgi:hypothetical protein